MQSRCAVRLRGVDVHRGIQQPTYRPGVLQLNGLDEAQVRSLRARAYCADGYNRYR